MEKIHKIKKDLSEEDLELKKIDKLLKTATDVAK